MDWIHDSQRRQAELEQAENNWYMQQMGQSPSDVSARVDMDGSTDVGSDFKSGGVSGSGIGDEMRGNTILGDVHLPSPVVVQQSPPPSPVAASPLLPIVLSSLIGAGIPLAGIAGYALSALSKAAPAVQQKFDDETLELGLGKIEDYFKKPKD